MVIKQFGNLGIGTQTPEFRLHVNGNVRLNAINLQTVTNQTSTQLGYRINNVLFGATGASNTWVEPSSSSGRITLASQGVYLLSYSFTTRSSGATILMGALTLLSNSNTTYTSPNSTNVPSSVFAFSGHTNNGANYNSCANSYVYVNTTENTTIYLWWASSVANQPIQGEGGYFQAVRIA